MRSAQDRMNTLTPFQIFKKKLLVAEPWRSTILTDVQQRMDGDSKILADPSALAYQYNRKLLGFITTPRRGALFGLFLGAVFVFIASGMYFEQWWWRIESWERHYYFDWWPIFTKMELVVSIFAIILFYVVMLPKVARSMTRSTIPLSFFLHSIVPIYIVLAGLYSISKFAVTGRDRLENILRDIGGVQPSILIVLTIFVLFPLALMSIGMLWWQKKHKAVHPGDVVR